MGTPLKKAGNIAKVVFPVAYLANAALWAGGKAAGAAGGLWGKDDGPGSPPATPPPPPAAGATGQDAAQVSAAVASTRVRRAMGAGRKSTFLGATYNTGATVFPAEAAQPAPPGAGKGALKDRMRTAIDGLRDRSDPGGTLPKVAAAIRKRRSYIGGL